MLLLVSLIGHLVTNLDVSRRRDDMLCDVDGPCDHDNCVSYRKNFEGRKKQKNPRTPFLWRARV